MEEKERSCEAESNKALKGGGVEVLADLMGDEMRHEEEKIIKHTVKGDMMLLLEKHIGTVSKATMILPVPYFGDSIRSFNF